MESYSKFLYCSLLLLLLTCEVNGQGLLYTQVSKYYNQKNKAELAIMNEQYDSALIAYKRAFSVMFPNERDIYNAFHVAYNLRDSATAEEYLSIIFLHGQEKDKYELTPFGKSIAIEDFYKWCSRNYDSLHTIALNSNMPLLAAGLDSIFIKDQHIRKRSEYKKTEINLRFADSVNLAEMEKFIERYGFPNYQLVGLFEECKGGFPGGFSTIDLLLWHTRHSLRTLNGAIRSAAAKGLLSPEEYTFYIDAQGDNIAYYSILPRNEINGSISIDSLKDADGVEQRRQLAMTCPLSEYYRKFRYQEDRKSGRFQFFFLPLFARFANALPQGSEF